MRHGYNFRHEIHPARKPVRMPSSPPSQAPPSWSRRRWLYAKESSWSMAYLALCLGQEVKARLQRHTTQRATCGESTEIDPAGRASSRRAAHTTNPSSFNAWLRVCLLATLQYPHTTHQRKKRSTVQTSRSEPVDCHVARVNPMVLGYCTTCECLSQIAQMEEGTLI